MSIMDREGIGTSWKRLYIAVFHTFAFNASVAKPSPCIVFWVGLVLYNLIRCFTPQKSIPTIILNFRSHSPYNIKSKALVNELALLRATAGGRCEKKLIKGGGN